MNADENRFDEQKSEQIAQLEKLVDEYRAETTEGARELSTRETLQDELQPRGTKRLHQPTMTLRMRESLSCFERIERTRIVVKNRSKLQRF